MKFCADINSSGCDLGMLYYENSEEEHALKIKSTLSKVQGLELPEGLEGEGLTEKVQPNRSFAYVFFPTGDRATFSYSYLPQFIEPE